MIGMLVLSLLIDATPRFHQGDSESYLGSEWHGYMPDDRAWAYGLVAVRLIRWTGNLDVVALLQIVIGWCGAWVLGAMLSSRFGRGGLWVVAVTGIIIGNPLSFYWARAFMTDTAAAALFGCCVTLMLWPAGRARPVLSACAMFCLAVLLGQLRSVYLPPMLAAFMGVALLNVARDVRGRKAILSPVVRRYAAFSLAVLLASLACGKINQYALQKPYPALNYAANRFLVSAWSPVMGPVLPQLNLPPAVNDGLLPLTYDNRLATAFADSGLPVRIEAWMGGADQARPLYSRLLRQTVMTQPVPFAALIARSWSDYLNPARVLLYHHERRLTGTMGYSQPDTLTPRFIARLQGFGIWQRVDPNLPQVPSFGIGYYARLGGWWALLLAWSATLSPLVCLALIRRHKAGEAEDDDLGVVLATQLFGFATIAMVALTTNELVTRYLIPLDIPLLVLSGWLLRRRDQ